MFDEKLKLVSGGFSNFSKKAGSGIAGLLLLVQPNAFVSGLGKSITPL